ncbi:MAG: hypothetical protein Q9217_006073 [Psora testacea]
MDIMGLRNRTHPQFSCSIPNARLTSIFWQPSGEHIHYTYGLHRRCSSLTHTCSYFPQLTDCHNDRYFCSMWRSVGFLMSFAVVMEGMTIIAYIIIIAGGKQKRETGWKVLAGFHLLVGVLLGAGMSIIVSPMGSFRRSIHGIGRAEMLTARCDAQAYLYDHDDRFFPGWKLDTSWIFCTVSFGVALLLAGGLSATAVMLPSERGYELIPTDEEE